ncbi:MAG: hypothetical protein CME70_03175 [Halobacteriovorax sp.]|nr:hypothetical protein [Halobacteriovorax sp.]MBK22985.1 hypothetical protein [Halobacteriovorax sp.]|tara:strand:+ start:12659 stop:13300 length:642 start_codon:yes stop_codon:yes gene_type:complete
MKKLKRILLNTLTISIALFGFTNPALGESQNFDCSPRTFIMKGDAKSQFHMTAIGFESSLDSYEYRLGRLRFSNDLEKVCKGVTKLYKNISKQKNLKNEIFRHLSRTGATFDGRYIDPMIFEYRNARSNLNAAVFNCQSGGTIEDIKKSIFESEKSFKETSLKASTDFRLNVLSRIDDHFDEATKKCSKCESKNNNEHIGFGFKSTGSKSKGK